MRLFVALDIDEAIRRRIFAFRERLRSFAPSVRWVQPETFHVTLQFLGETKRPDQVQQDLQRVQAPPVEVSFRGAGFFPSPRAPRVFWVGIEADANLHTLVSELASALRPLGFAPEPGPYTPHLTLARSGSGRPRPVPGERVAPGLHAVRAELETLPSPDFGTMTAHEFYLYESHSSPSGARYEKRAAYRLQ